MSTLSVNQINPISGNSLTLSGNNVTIPGDLIITGSTSFSGSVILPMVSQSLNFDNDTAAAAGGVPLGGLYRNGSFIQIRLV
jgi:hypothetical protein